MTTGISKSNLGLLALLLSLNSKLVTRERATKVNLQHLRSTRSKIRRDTDNTITLKIFKLTRFKLFPFNRIPLLNILLKSNFNRNIISDIFMNSNFNRNIISEYLVIEFINLNLKIKNA